ncbi:MAG: hypothetical protein VX343_04240 [Thermodesulfobacteriota bacterium]|nr:hypothetical protein [Thermodesulfobacteriota bacterium]
MIITSDNWNVFIEDNLSHYNKAIINGKGPSFKPIDNPIDNTLITCVNDCFHASNYTDLLVCNDIEFIERIDHSKLKALKYLAVPNKIHKGGIAQDDVSYLNVIEIVKKSFFGDLIVYNLKDQPKNNNFISLPTYLSSCHTAADIISLIPNIQTVDIYGVGGEGYSKLIPTPKVKTLWCPKMIRGGLDLIKNSLQGKTVTTH